MFVDLKMSLIDCNLYEEEVGVVHLAVTNSCRGSQKRSEAEDSNRVVVQ